VTAPVGAARGVAEEKGAAVERQQALEVVGDEAQRLLEAERGAEHLRYLVEHLGLAVRHRDVRERGGARQRDPERRRPDARRDPRAGGLHLPLERGEDLEELRHERRVQRRARVVAERPHGLDVGPGGPVGPVEQEGREEVHHREHARANGYPVALQAVRVAGAVPPLVVRQDQRGHGVGNGTASTMSAPTRGWIFTFWNSS